MGSFFELRVEFFKQSLRAKFPSREGPRARSAHSGNHPHAQSFRKPTIATKHSINTLRNPTSEMPESNFLETTFAELRTKPFDSSALLPNPLLRALYRPVQGIIEKRLGFSELNRIYTRCGGDNAEPGDFCQRALRQLQTSWSLAEPDRVRLRSIQGPLVIVANHPFGAIDSLCLIDLMEQIRPGAWKIFSNTLLRNVRPLGPDSIEVDALGLTDQAQQLNRKALKQALAFLKNGGCLALFPARRVANFDEKLGAVVDQPWSEHALKLAVKTGATLVCLHIPGQNSPEFLKIPLAQVRRRSLRLCREVVDAPPRQLQLSVALQLPPSDVKTWARLPNGTARLRARCFMEFDKQSLSAPKAKVTTTPKAPSPAVDTATDANALAALSPEQRLYRKDDLELLFIQGHEAPGLLKLLGHAREVTFRAAGQGVGKDVDLSPEDDYYHQLIVWDHSRNGIAGAYRTGMLSSILEAHGTTGLYLDSIFKIDPAFYGRFRDSLELSRSFVLPDYQRDNRVLPLLWTGLAIICRQRQIQTLFGSVTISNEFHPASRALLVEFLRREYADSAEICSWIEARRPFHPESRYHPLVAEAYAGENISKLDPIVQHLEDQKRGIPPLMRYYCQLGARFINYHVEPSFQDALYCLLRVDLPSVPDNYKRRFAAKA